MCEVSLTEFIKVDNALAGYYDKLGVTYNRNIDGYGIFLENIIEQEFNDPQLPISSELGDNCIPDDCSYIWMNNFIKEFPFSKYILINDDHQREELIFYILQFCYKHSQPPTEQYIKTTIIPKCDGVCILDTQPKELNKNKYDKIKASSYKNINDISYPAEIIQDFYEMAEQEFNSCQEFQRYLEISTQLQISQGLANIFIFPNNKKNLKLLIVNYDIDLKESNQFLYGIITESQSQSQWKLDNVLLDYEIESEFGIKKDELPPESKYPKDIHSKLKNYDADNNDDGDDQKYDQVLSEEESKNQVNALEKIVKLCEEKQKELRNEIIQQKKINCRNEKITTKQQQQPDVSPVMGKAYDVSELNGNICIDEMCIDDISIEENNLDKLTPKFKDKERLKEWLNFTTKLQISGGFSKQYIDKRDKYKIGIINYEIKDEDRSDLYGVLCDDMKLTKLLTAKEIYDKYGIDSNDLPLPSRQGLIFLKQLERKLTINDIDSIDWSLLKLDIDDNLNVNRETIKQYVDDILLNERSFIKPVPIGIMDEDDDNFCGVEWVLGIAINTCDAIYVSFRFIADKEEEEKQIFRATRIYCDDQIIKNKHALIGVEDENGNYSDSLTTFTTGNIHGR